MRRPPFSQKAFTLIEMMIGLAILALLLFLAMPGFSTMLHNMKIRGTAESIMGGLQVAKAEALKRNQTVEFILTADELDPESVDGFTADSAGPNWAVRAPSGDSYTFIEGRGSAESGQDADEGTVVELAATGGGVGFDGIVTFNGLGRTTLPAPLVITVSDPLGGACKTALDDAPMRCLEVEVSTNGRIRMCDPAVTDAADTRMCQY